MKKLGMIVLGFAAIVAVGSLAQAATDDDMGEAKKFSMHGEVRFRGEWFTNMTDFTDTDTADPNNTGSFGADDDTHDLFPWRVRFGAKGDLGNDIWVYGEFQGIGVAGTTSADGGDEQTRGFFGNSIDNGTDVDLYQGYIKWKDVGSSNLDLTFGRQEIAFDRGLHYSSLDFYNGISHDGVMAAWDYENFGVHGFWIKSDEDQSGLTGAVDQSDDESLGVHFKHMVGKDKNQDVAYYLFYHLDRFSGIGKSAVYTLGGRWGKDVEDKAGLFWNAELAIQSGDAVDTPSTSIDQSSHIFEGEIGWAFAEAKQRVWFNALLASGDDDPNDEENGTYMPIHADFHNRLGYADLFDLQNITALSVGYKYMANERHAFGGSYYMFTKTEDEDFVYFSPIHPGLPFGNSSIGSCVSSSTVSCEDDLGNELDLYYNYHPTGNFGFDLAWSIFTPGDVFKTDIGTPTAPDNVGEDTAWRFTAQARARW